MKRSFTTLGCPDWTLDEILRHAPAMGFDGVDFRFLEGTTTLWERPALSTQLSQSARLLADAVLEVTHHERERMRTERRTDAVD